MFGLGVVGDCVSVCRALKHQLKELRRQQELVVSWRERGVNFSERAILRLGSGAIVEIGRGSTIGEYTVLDLTNDPNPSPAQSPVLARLVIGNNTAINEFNNIRAAGGTILIGDNCLVAQYVSIIASNHSVDAGVPIRQASWDTCRNTVEIGDDVWIGTHAVILPGVKVGRGSIIAAGAVVTHDVPEWAVVAGIPARLVRYRRIPQISVNSQLVVQHEPDLD